MSLLGSADGVGSATAHEMLFLICTYLTNHTPCADLSLQLAAELEKAGLLGTTYTWDGQARPTKMNDLKVKFSNVKSDQLLNHLLRYVRQVQSVDPFRSTSVMVPSDDDATASPAALSPEDMIACAKKLIDLCRTRASNSANVENKMEIDGEVHAANLDKDIEECICSLTKCDFGASFALGSNVSCGLHMLTARSCGLVGFYAPTPAALMKGSRSSFISQKIRMTSNYNLFWRGSGHLSNPAYNVAFDKSGRYVITGADDALVKIWDVERGLLLRTLRGHQGCISQLSISPDNSMVASCCTMGTIRVWRLADGYCLAVFKTPGAGCVNWIMFDFASTALISVSDDGCCVVWDLFEHIVVKGTTDTDSAVLNIIRRVKGTTSSGARESIFPQAITEENHSFPDVSMSSGLQADDIAAVEGRKQQNAIGNVDPFFLHDQKFLLAASNMRPDRALPWTDLMPANMPRGQLLLEHFKDTSYTDRRSIVALDICPMDRVIVTGCNDGLAQIWRFGEKYHGPDEIDSQKKRPFFENIAKAMEEVTSQAHRRTDESFARSNLHMLCRLEGHLSAVMDIKFSRAGDRVVTGSTKDGTVRVWSFTKDFSQTEHIIIDLNETEDDAAQVGNVYNGSFRGRQNRTSRQAKSQVYNLCWSCDDSYILILHSAQSKNSAGGSRFADAAEISSRLKQFDSLTGELLNVIDLFDKRVDMLAAHPLNPMVALTGGNDGIVVVWNFIESNPICEHVINIEAPLTLEQINSVRGQNGDDAQILIPAEITDMCFTDDGAKFAITDSYGRVSVFGLGEVSSSFEGKYPEQYFSTDYHAVTFIAEGDPRGYDEGTMEPLNECLPGPLCRVDGSPYEDQPAALLKFVGQSWDETVRRVVDIVDGARTFEKVLERSYVAYKRVNKQKQLGVSQPRITRGAWATNASNSTGSSNVHTIQTLSRRSAAAVANSRLAGSYDYDGQGDDFASTMLYRSGSGRNNANSSSQRAAYRSSSDESSDDEMFVPSKSERSTRAARRATSRRNWNSDQSDTSDSGAETSSCNDDAFDFASTPARTSRGHPSPGGRRSKPARAPQAKGSSKQNSKKEKKVKLKQSKDTLRPWGTINGHRTVPVGEIVDRSWLQQDEPNDLQYCPQCGDHVVYFPQGHIEHLQDFPETTAPPWISFGSKFPVVECRISSIEYEFPSNREHARCRSVIARIRLVVLGFPLKWSPTGSSASNTAHMFKEFGQLRATRHSTFKNEIEFDVNLRSANAPDFLVPMYLYMRSAKVQWRPGMRFQTYFKEDAGATASSHILMSPQASSSNTSSTPVVGAHSSSMAVYTGKIVFIKDSEPEEWPKSPWESLGVIWTVGSNGVILWDDSHDDSEAPIDRVSPWDAYLLNVISLNGRTGAVRMDSTAASSSSEHNSLSNISSNGQSRILPTIRENVLEKIDELVGGEDDGDIGEFAPFSAPVDAGVFADYYSYVPVPIDLQVIENRLQNNFYRQIEALEFDISLLHSNCLLYNVEDSAIVQLSRKLMSILLVVSSGGIYEEADMGSVAAAIGVETVSDDAHKDSISHQGQKKTGLMLQIRGRSNSNISDINDLDREIAASEAGDSHDDSDGDEMPQKEISIKLRARKREDESSDKSESDEDIPSQRITRRRIILRGAKESSEGSSDSDFDNEETTFGKHANLRNVSSKPQKKKARVEPARSSRNSLKRKPTYAEESGDDSSEENEGESESESEENGPSTARSRRSTSSKAQTTVVKKEAKEATAPKISNRLSGEDIYTDIMWPSFNIIVGEDAWELFANPVTDEVAPGYSKEIPRPTDLSTIRRNLESSKYRTVNQYKEEVLRMFANCEKYNGLESEYGEESARLRGIFLEYI